MPSKKLYTGIILIVIMVIITIFVRLSLNGSRDSFKVKIITNSLAPILTQGSIVRVNKKFTEADLKEGTVVVFRNGGKLIVKIIYKIEDDKYFVRNVRYSSGSEVISRKDIIGIISR